MIVFAVISTLAFMALAERFVRALRGLARWVFRIVREWRYIEETRLRALELERATKREPIGYRR